jgi:NAD(P)-dependent dehydrogenase (short-subunit alcohol dehydrogenase family)
MNKFSESVYLVTGATSGIGEATARGLARLGARVIVHGRNREKCAAAVRAIASDTGNDRIEWVSADFTSLGEVRALANDLNARLPRLDVLVNNAGGSARKRTLTREGFEQNFGVNHLAPFLLTNLLIDKLKASAPSRIVNVSSMMHRMASINFDDLQSERRFGGMRTYGQSKLANILFTRSLARRLAGSRVTANALHPGAVNTALSGTNSGPLAWVAGYLMLSPEQGARTSLYLSTAPEVADVSGQYFIKCKPAVPSREAQDDRVAERLWQVSAQLTGLPS